ncbi:MAG: FAD-binding protein, partial [Pseudomonadota bacterium]
MATQADKTAPRGDAPASEYDVIIIGSGAAGLTAAHELATRLRVL